MESLGKILEGFKKQMPEEITVSDMPSMERKAMTLNEAEGSLDEVHCSKCRDKGYIASIQDGELITRECTCMAKRRSMRRARRSGMMDILTKYTFASYQAPNEWQAAAKKLAMEYVTGGDLGAWLLVSGTPGSGKTHLCTAVCGELIKAGKDVAYMLWREDGQRLKASAADREEYDRLMRPFKTADVLYVDDFMKGGITAGDLNLAFDLLNARYIARRRQTIISSELDINRLLEIDEAIGSRIYERSHGYTIRTAAENWRLRPRKENT